MAVMNLRSSLKMNVTSEGHDNSMEQCNSTTKSLASQPFWGSVSPEAEPLTIPINYTDATHDSPVFSEENVPMSSEPTSNGFDGTPKSINSDRETPPQRLKQWEQKCDLCGLTLLGGQQRFEAHMKNAHEIWCACGLSFKSKAKATNHIKMMSRTGVVVDSHEHRIIPGGKIKPMFECDFCDEIFRHRNLAVRHRNVVHLNMAENAEHKRTYRKKAQVTIDSPPPPKKLKKVVHNSDNGALTKNSTYCGVRPEKQTNGKSTTVSSPEASCVVTPSHLPPISQIRSKHDWPANPNTFSAGQISSVIVNNGFNDGTMYPRQGDDRIPFGLTPVPALNQHLSTLGYNSVIVSRNHVNSTAFSASADTFTHPPSQEFKQ